MKTTKKMSNILHWKTKMNSVYVYIIIFLKTLKLISYHWSLSITPENIRRPLLPFRKTEAATGSVL